MDKELFDLIMNQPKLSDIDFLKSSIDTGVKESMLYYFLYGLCNLFVNRFTENYFELLDECLNIMRGTLNYYGKGNFDLEQELFFTLVKKFIEMQDKMYSTVTEYNINFITE